jgi:hypothetical protein
VIVGMLLVFFVLYYDAVADFHHNGSINYYHFNGNFDMGWCGFLMFVCGFMSLLAAGHVKACTVNNNIYMCNLLAS